MPYLVTLKDGIATNHSTRYFREVIAKRVFPDEHTREMDAPHLFLEHVTLYDVEGMVDLGDGDILRIPMTNVLGMECWTDCNEE